MSSAMIIRPIIWPAALRDDSWRVQYNGRIPSNLMVTEGKVTLLKVAMRTNRAMVGAAALGGTVLRPTSALDTYRPLAAQESTFLARYQDTPYPGWTQRKWWRGKWWYRKPNVATAAVPGTSNHGFGLAEDFDLGAPGNPEAWLEAHAIDYGWSGELIEEAWHYRHVAGDRVPIAVLEWESFVGMLDELMNKYPTGEADRPVGNALALITNAVRYLYDAPGGAGTYGAPPAGSRLAMMAAAAEGDGIDQAALDLAVSKAVTAAFADPSAAFVAAIAQAVRDEIIKPD